MRSRSRCPIEVTPYLWQCGEASQLSSPKIALWYHLNRWPDIWNKQQICLNPPRAVSSDTITVSSPPIVVISEVLTCRWGWKQLRWPLPCVPVACWYSGPQLEPWTRPAAGTPLAGLALSRPQEPSHTTPDWTPPQPLHAQKMPAALAPPAGDNSRKQDVFTEF